MSRRIRTLENALRVDRAALSADPHPLLAEELLEIKKGTSSPDLHNNLDDLEDSHDNDGVADSLGLLSMNEGEARFVGASGSEQLVLMTDTKDEALASDQAGISGTASFPVDILEAASTWPFTPPSDSTSDLQAQIEAQLPCYDRAKELCDAFTGTFCWWVRPVTHEQLYDELLPMVYNRFGQDVHGQAPTAEGTHSGQADRHDLALLFIILACGAHADFNLPFHNEDTKRYRQLARAALASKSVFDTATLSAVQAIALMAQLDVLLGRDNALESSWRLMCLTLSLAMSIGLHRDPARWNLGPTLVHRRRQAFWSVYLSALWKALSCGKPITISADTIDCEFPDDIEAVKAPDGTTLPSSWRLFHTFTKEILATLTDRVCAARPPRYAEILDMDRKLTEHESHVANILDACISLIPKESLQTLDRQTQMNFNTPNLMGSLAMMYTHRNYFARALLEHPKHPLESPFARSFLACFSCATIILKLTRENFRRDPDMTLRCWPIWEHSIAATIIVGFVATQRAGSEEALAALEELDLAIGVFRDAIIHPFVKHGLPILIRVREKAIRAATSQLQLDSLSGSSSANDEFDLGIFNGVTRVVVEGKSAKGSPDPSLPGTSTRSSPHLTPPLQSSLNTVPNDQMDGMSWGTLNASTGSLNFVEPNHAYANVANTAPPSVFPPGPLSRQQPQQMAQQPVLSNTTFSPYPFTLPSQSSAGLSDMFATPFVPPQLTEWSSVIPNLANFGGGAGEYMTTEAMVNNPGISYAAEQASDINLAALLPSLENTSAAVGMPCATERHTSIPHSTVASNAPFTSDQQHAYTNRDSFDDALRAILTT